MFKKTLALILTLATLLSVLNLSVFAETTGKTEVTIKGSFSCNYIQNDVKNSYNLSNFEVDLTCLVDGKEIKKTVKTGAKGEFSVKVSALDISTITVKGSIKAENSACYVTSRKDFYGKYPTYSVKIPKTTNTKKNTVIDLGNFKGGKSFYIAKSMEKASGSCEKEIGVNLDKIMLVWDTRPKYKVNGIPYFLTPDGVKIEEFVGLEGQPYGVEPKIIVAIRFYDYSNSKRLIENFNYVYKYVGDSIGFFEYGYDAKLKPDGDIDYSYENKFSRVDFSKTFNSFEEGDVYYDNYFKDFYSDVIKKLINKECQNFVAFEMNQGIYIEREGDDIVLKTIWQGE